MAVFYKNSLQHLKENACEKHEIISNGLKGLRDTLKKIFFKVTNVKTKSLSQTTYEVVPELKLAFYSVKECF